MRARLRAAVRGSRRAGGCVHEPVLQHRPDRQPDRRFPRARRGAYRQRAGGHVRGRACRTQSQEGDPGAGRQRSGADPGGRAARSRGGTVRDGPHVQLGAGLRQYQARDRGGQDSGRPDAGGAEGAVCRHQGGRPHGRDHVARPPRQRTRAGRAAQADRGRQGCRRDDRLRWQAGGPPRLLPRADHHH
ncbi:hypothetical protein D3C86_1559170 [compost metagenome]